MSLKYVDYFRLHINFKLQIKANHIAKQYDTVEPQISKPNMVLRMSENGDFTRKTGMAAMQTKKKTRFGSQKPDTLLGDSIRLKGSMVDFNLMVAH